MLLDLICLVQNFPDRHIIIEKLLEEGRGFPCQLLDIANKL